MRKQDQWKGCHCAGHNFFRSWGTVNLGLGSSKSRWTGVSDNEDERPVNLYLSDGGIWENRQTAKDQYGLFAGSRVTKVAGGTTPAKAGVIAQKDSNPITIDHYSGHTILVYDHEASSPATMIGGDTIIANAEAGSGITMRTNSRGLIQILARQKIRIW